MLLARSAQYNGQIQFGHGMDYYFIIKMTNNRGSIQSSNSSSIKTNLILVLLFRIIIIINQILVFMNPQIVHPYTH